MFDQLNEIYTVRWMKLVSTMKLSLQILKKLGHISTLLSYITLLVSVTYLVIWCKHERQKIAAIPHLVFSRVHQLLAISGLHTKMKSVSTMKLTLQILKELGRNSTLLSCITLLVSANLPKNIDVFYLHS